MEPQTHQLIGNVLMSSCIICSYRWTAFTIATNITLFSKAIYVGYVFHIHTQMAEGTMNDTNLFLGIK